MTSAVALTGAQPRSALRSIGAVLAGFVAVVVLSTVTDQVLHVLNVYPPWGQSMDDPGLNMLALSYRAVYTILGGYITARLAPHSPMRHVLALAILGLVAGIAGVVVALTVMSGQGPLWYPIAVALTGPPCAWLGGVLQQRKR